MGERRAYSLWPILFVLVFLIGGLTTCRRATIDAVNDASLWDRGDGMPLDHAGNLLKCPDCGSVARFSGGYLYRCESPDCRAEFEATYDSRTGAISFRR